MIKKMTKTVFAFYLVMSLLVTGFGLFFPQTASASDETDDIGLGLHGFLLLGALTSSDSDETSEIKRLVSTFYDNYIQALEKDELTDDYLQRQPEVDEALVLKIKKLIKEAEESEFGYLEYDPILLAQDIPTGWKYEDTVINGDEARLTVYKLWDGRSDNDPNCVSLKKKNGRWRITDIDYVETCGK